MQGWEEDYLNAYKTLEQGYYYVLTSENGKNIPKQNLGGSLDEKVTKCTESKMNIILKNNKLKEVGNIVSKDLGDDFYLNPKKYNQENILKTFSQIDNLIKKQKWI